MDRQFIEALGNAADYIYGQGTYPQNRGTEGRAGRGFRRQSVGQLTPGGRILEAGGQRITIRQSLCVKLRLVSANRS